MLLTAARALPLIVAALAVAWISLYAMLETGPVFNTPDETSNYIAAGEFSRSGRLYLESDLTRIDRENLLHTRGFITHQGRAVPMQFHGHTVFWGSMMKIFGADAWRYVGPALALFFIIFLHRLFRLAAPKASPVLFLFCFAAPSVIYLLGRPFLSASLATVLTVPAFCYAISYIRTRNRTALLLFSVFLALSLQARPDNIPLALAALYLVIGQARGTWFNRAMLRDGAIFLLVFAVLFVIPVMALNQLTYGSPLTFGYQLVDQTVGLRDTPAQSLSGVARLLRLVRNILFPFDTSTVSALAGLIKYIILLSPLLALAALSNLDRLVSQLIDSKQRWRVVGALALAGYLVFSRAAEGLYGMVRLTPDIVDSLARYWMPLYLVLLVASWRSLARIKLRWVQAVVAVLALALGSFGIFQQWQQSYVPMTRDINESADVWGKVARSTERDAVIYCDRVDKFIVPHRTVAAWWETGSSTTYDPVLLARSAARVLDLGRPVYLEKNAVETFALRPVLTEHGLALDRTRRTRDLLEIIVRPPQDDQVDTPPNPP